MENVFEINRKKVFSIDQARTLLPVVYRISEEAEREVHVLMNRAKAFADKKHPRALEIENQINEIIATWQRKVERLGCEPKGLWMADFDKGDGYFCWKYPETEIKYWHGYQDGFSGRILVE